MSQDPSAADATREAQRASRVRRVAENPEEDARTRQFLVECCRHLADMHCEHILAYDVRGMSDVTDYIVLATGTSDRQIRSVGEDLEEIGEKYDMSRFGGERDSKTSWLVADFVDVVFHLFDAHARAHYDLEMLWGDAPEVAWRRDGTGPSE